MSFIADLNNFAIKSLRSLMLFTMSVIILACVLYLFLPSLLGGNLNRRTQTSQTSQITQRTQPLDQQQQIEDTRLRLIFRTHADLADRLGVPQQDITLNEVKRKMWTDTSLECPSPFRGTPLVNISQRTTMPGWLMTWKLGNTIYEYNTSVKGDWVLCSKIEIPNDIAQYRSPADK